MVEKIRKCSNLSASHFQTVLVLCSDVPGRSRRHGEALDAVDPPGGQRSWRSWWQRLPVYASLGSHMSSLRKKSPRLTTSPPHQLQRFPSKQSPGNPHQIPSKKSRSLPSRSLGLETEVWRNAASGHDFCGRIRPSSRQRVMLCACGSVFCIPSECLRTSWNCMVILHLPFQASILSVPVQYWSVIELRLHYSSLQFRIRTQKNASPKRVPLNWDHCEWSE